ncbi:hypothetical protein [Amycolatopsis aidingensis]|uniref:hypothetical protein n=1 Tax=Amycolatopsis aidingensis TaxID=2842453 RepID=UPI001C0B6B0E|nr:hypothetical protein [Amycolatopsis aidingensis]
MRNERVPSELLADITDEFAHQVRAIQTYPVREIYTMISAGRPAEVGLRGYPAVQTTTAAGNYRRGRERSAQ